MKNILKYVFIYVVTVIILFAALVITSKIPKSAIYSNLKESANYYRNLPGIKRKSLNKEYEALHYAADSKLLNIMYHIDSDNPIVSSMEARFYDKCLYDSNEDFVKTVDYNIGANEQYIRYWHGSLTILRPLMVILNIEQIYTLNKIIFWILLIALVIIIFKRYKLLAIVFAIASIMVSLSVTPNCLEYTWTVFIMLIISIISLLIEKKGNKKLYVMYFITGIITCYFDFLSTETLTILIPILLTLLVRYKDNRIKGFKDEFKFVFISCILWFTSYCLMWFTKWCLASIILNINALDYVKDNALLRMNMSDDNEIIKYNFKEVLLVNILKIYPINKLLSNSKLILIFLAIILILFIKTIVEIIKNIKNNTKIQSKSFIKILLFVIGIIPYVRYFFMMNHSYCHSFFTFRAQMPSIICVVFIIIYSVNINIIKNIFKSVIKKLKR